MAIKVSGTTVIDDSRNANTGILTATSSIVGSAVTTNATGINITGIGTFSSRLNVGTGLTANSTGVNVTGVVTATSFRGDGSNLTGVAAAGGGSFDITASLFV
jgi:hypothetical protein